MNTNLQKIGELLAQCRKNKGLTQEEVGVMIGVQKAMVSKVENGLCVNFGTVNRIAEALGVEPIVALKSKKKADKNLIDYVMTDRKSTRLNSSHSRASRMPSSA